MLQGVKAFFTGDLSERAVGAIFLMLFAALFWFFVYAPLIDAAHGKEEISYSMKWVLFQPLLLGWGLISVILGARTTKVFGPISKPSIVGWIGLAVLLALGFLAHYQMKISLEAYGYYLS